jgi:hypothetical protein
MTWDCCAGHYFDFLLRRCLAFNIFPFPATTAKLIGDFYNNRRSAAHGCPRFAYSLVFLMLRQYFWRYDSYSANRQSAANMKIRENFFIGAAKGPASPKGAANARCFAYKRRAQRSTNNISRVFYIAPIVLALSRS